MDQRSKHAPPEARQRLFREVNDQIARLSGVAGGDQLAVLCECANLHCVELIDLPRSEYDAVRSHPKHFAVKPKHEVFAEGDTVVARRGAYVVVESPAGAGGDFSEARAVNDREGLR